MFYILVYVQKKEKKESLSFSNLEKGGFLRTDSMHSYVHDPHTVIKETVLRDFLVIMKHLLHNYEEMEVILLLTVFNNTVVCYPSRKG